MGNFEPGARACLVASAIGLTIEVTWLIYHPTNTIYGVIRALLPGYLAFAISLRYDSTLKKERGLADSKFRHRRAIVINLIFCIAAVGLIFQAFEIGFDPR